MNALLSSVLRGSGPLILLALLLFAPGARAQCTYATPTTGQVYSMPTLGLVTQIYGSRMQSSWVVTAVSGVPGDDWDVALYQNSATSSPCVANQLASSTYGGNSVDFVIGDYTVNPHTDVYARHNRYSGTGVGRAQWRDGAGALVVNGFDTNRTWGVDSLVDVWQVTLTAGVTYTLNFSPSAGLGASLLVFRNPSSGTYWAPRAGALATLTATGTYTAPATGSYALVVVNDGHAAGTYALEVGDCTPLALTSNVIRTHVGKQAVWQFGQNTPYWTVVAAQGAPIEVYSANFGAYPVCVSGLLESSPLPNTITNFVVGNFNAIPTGSFYARTAALAGASDIDVLWDGAPDQLVADGPPVHRIVNNTTRQFAEAWDLYMVAGQSYHFYLESSAMAFGMFLFADPGAGNHWMNWNDAVVSGTQSFDYTATATGFYGLVVTHGYHTTGWYTMGVSKAPCAEPIDLVSQTPVSVPSPDRWYRMYPTGGHWTAVGVRGANTSDDWNLGVSADPTGQPAPQCIGPLLASSSAGAGIVDLAVVDYYEGTWSDRFINAHHVSATSASGVIEFDASHGTLTANAPHQLVAMSASTLAHVYDAYMYTGYTYSVEFTPGAAGQSVLVFENPSGGSYAASRASALASGSGTFTFTPTVNGMHAIVVVNDAGAAGTYRLRYGRCFGATYLSNNVGALAPTSYSTFAFGTANPRWSAVGVRSGTADWDLQLSAGLGSTFPNCIGTALATSTSSALQYVDFVVGDAHHMAPATYYASIYQYTSGAATPAWVNWSSATTALVPNVINMAPTVTGESSPVTVFDTHLEAGITYTIGLTHTGSANLHLLLFRNPGSGTYWAGRSSAVLDLAVASGSASYTPPVADDYALVVVNDDGLNDTFIPSVRYCPPTVALLNHVSMTVSPSAFVSFVPLGGWWSAIGARSESDWDVEVYRTGGGGAPGLCFSNLLALSNSANVVDFVIGDFNAGGNAAGTYYARPYAYHALSYPGTVEYEAGGALLAVGSPVVTRTTSSSDVIQVWDVLMLAGSDYNLYFTHQGSADLKALLFRNPGGEYWAPRSARVLETTGHADYHCTVSGYYGLVVANDNGLPGEYAIGLQPAGVAVEEEALPSKTALNRVSPNPARGPFSVQFALHQAATVRIELLDLSGRRVAMIEDGVREAGNWNVAWSGGQGAAGSLPPGLYCLRLQAGGRTVGEKKVVLIR